MLDAHRDAATQTRLANEDVLQGWMWSCSLTERSCCTCIALHGTIHPIDEDMLEHQSGRCAPVPLTKTWRELGFDVDEPERHDMAVQTVINTPQWTDWDGDRLMRRGEVDGVIFHHP
ncbi:MAG: phage head morphogenesis protein [Cellulomonadaceae bacterium]|jgi:hypothetical protein|nr:phage head morphogenesis protein [Cellulomonadaceae bacterium]